MRIGDHKEFVEVRLVERTPHDLPGAGDLRLQVRVACCGFQGEYDQVWVAGPEFADFLAQLQALEEHRQGSALLLSMSPDELVLEIHSTDPAGHMAVTGQLRRFCFAGRGETSWCQIPFDIPLPCPSLLPQLLAEFQAMAASD